MTVHWIVIGHFISIIFWSHGKIGQKYCKLVSLIHGKFAGYLHLVKSSTYDGRVCYTDETDKAVAFIQDLKLGISLFFFNFED